MPKQQTTPDVALKANQAYNLSQQVIAENLQLDREGKRYSKQDILDVLMQASVRNSSIERVCDELTDAPSANVVRAALLELYPEDLREWEKHISEMLVTKLPKKLLDKRLVCAIDITDLSYYGRDEGDFVRKSKPKAGTYRFHCYASLYVIKRNKRYTLAVTILHGDEKVIAALKRLVAQVEALGLRFKRLLLDRGFDNNDVIHYLQDKQIHAFMPMTRRGANVKALLSSKRSFKCSWRRNSETYGEALFYLVLVCRYKKGKRGKHGLIRHLYLSTFPTKLEPLQLHQEYRCRFGIESSYRLMNICRARTCSTSAFYRLLLVCLAFVLVNLWAFLKWRFLYPLRPGPRLVWHELFPLETFCLWLEDLIKQRLGLRLVLVLPPSDG